MNVCSVYCYRKCRCIVWYVMGDPPKTLVAPAGHSALEIRQWKCDGGPDHDWSSVRLAKRNKYFLHLTKSHQEHLFASIAARWY